MVFRRIWFYKNFGKRNILKGSNKNLKNIHRNFIKIFHLEISPITLSYAEWISSCFLVSLSLFLILVLFMNLWFLGCSSFENSKNSRIDEILSKRFDELGTIRKEEIMVSLAFISLILLWFFRNPGFIPGWQNLFPFPGFKNFDNVN